MRRLSRIEPSEISELRRKSLGGESASTATTCEGPQSDPESGGESEASRTVQ